MTVEDTYNQHKPRELDVKYDVYVTSRGPNIPCQEYKGIIDVINK